MPEPRLRRVETGKAASVAARQTERANESKPRLRPCRSRHVASGFVWWGVAEETVEETTVDRGEARDIGEIDALIDLVHRLADKTELGDRAMHVDKPRIRGAAGGAELR